MQQIITQFLKPPKLTYNQYDLGPRKFILSNSTFSREQHIVNGIPFSFYSHQLNQNLSNQNRPILIYVHSYNSNKIQVRSILNPLLQNGFNVIALEFQRVYIGQGRLPQLNNQKGLISFGYYQYEQIRHIVKWAKYKNPSEIILWGRSMGAVSAIKYQGIYQGVNKIVLDSPFHDLQELFSVKAKQLMKVPQIITKGILKIFESQINTHFKFQIKDLKMRHYMNFNCPTAFICNKNDPMSGQATQMLYQKCIGKKQLIYTLAEHSAERQNSVIEQTIRFLIEKKRQSPIRKVIRARSSLKQMKTLFKKSLNKDIVDEKCSQSKINQFSDCRTQQTNNLEKKQLIEFQKQPIKLNCKRANFMCFF